MEKQHSWEGVWITAEEKGPLLRRSFQYKKSGERVYALVAGLGWHELYVNGKKADDRVLAPVVTQYEKRVSCIRYDITEFLEPGTNALGVMLGNGWYNCRYPQNAWNFEYASWIDLPKLLCNVVTDGKVILKTDCSWKTAAGPILFNSLRNGETYDARCEIDGWSMPEFDDSSWKNAVQCAPPPGILVEEDMEPCKECECFPCINVKTLGDGSRVYDFGRNLTGWARIQVRGSAGSTLVLKYSECLAPDGDIDQGNIDLYIKEGEFQTDRYTLKGAPDGETWSPRFTYHGFRYLKISGVTADVVIEKVEALFVHNAFPSAGLFKCSSELLNRLSKCARQSYLSNFTGIPTDCPHREKNGWTGDAQIACEAGLWNYNSVRAYKHFIQMLVDAQRPSGQLPGIVPTGGWGYNWGSGPAWDSALFEIPFRVLRYYGDDEMIRLHYEAMRRYIDFCTGMSENCLVNFGLGDWCMPNRAPVKTVELTSSAYYYYDTWLFSRFATLVGEAENDVYLYSRLAEDIKLSFNTKFYRGDGVYGDGSWTALAAPLYFGLAPQGEEQKIADLLASKVAANGYKADFGILGAKYVPRVLADYGYAEHAFRLITQEEFPGWGYWIRKGATTLWEDWSGGSSHNHIMFGDVSAWMFEYLAGVKPLKNGFAEFRVAPNAVGGLTNLIMTHDAPCGKIVVDWTREEKRFILTLTVPKGATAEVILPGGGSSRAGEGVQFFEVEME